MSYTLKLAKKPSRSFHEPLPPTRKAIFEEEDSGSGDDLNSEVPESVEIVGEFVSASPRNTLQDARSRCPKDDFYTKLVPKDPPHISQKANLSIKHTATKYAVAARSLDRSIYDYDAVYNSLHAKAKSKSLSSVDKRPKYMGNLLAAAEVRKRDQLRAKEKLLAKEREAEGKEFADKEKFVTEAYKLQQLEARRQEEEEERREKEETEKKRQGRGEMTELYRGFLDREEQRHEGLLRATQNGVDEINDTVHPEEESLRELATEKGAVVNEDGQVVDKRQLLNAGLNLVSKPRPVPSTQSKNEVRNLARMAGPTSFHAGREKQATRERQSRMLEAQLVEATKRAADDEDMRLEDLERTAKSRKTETDIRSAKERYLQRKREAATASIVAGKES